VLKLGQSLFYYEQFTVTRSQTFPEGKGVETSCNFPHGHLSHQASQTFPEGKGVETSGTGLDRSLSIWSQTFPEGKGVETAIGHGMGLRLCNVRQVADLPRR